MLAEALQEAIVKVYAETAIPADQVVCDVGLATRFAAAVNEEVGPEESYPQPEISRGLLYLRKKGLLPRLVR
jgi:hypothetical protein